MNDGFTGAGVAAPAAPNFWSRYINHRLAVKSVTLDIQDAERKLLEVTPDNRVKVERPAGGEEYVDLTMEMAGEILQQIV